MENEQKVREIFEKLSAPFTKTVNGKVYPAHKWLPKDFKSVPGKVRCFPYVSGGQVRDRLNEVLGVDGWMFKSKLEVDGTRTGTLSVCINGEWIDRDGVGTKSKENKSDESNQDAEKGAETDALKRAAKNFGVASYLDNISHFFIGASGKKPIDNNGRPLYGNQLHDYINGYSCEQGLLTQILMINPKAWEIEEFKTLWNKFNL